MGACCSLLTGLSTEKTREEILALSVDGEEPGPRIIPGSGSRSQGSLTVSWRPGNSGKPLLGYPAWRVDIRRCDLGTVVDFSRIIPWRALGTTAVLSLAPGLGAGIFFPHTGLGLPFAAFGLIFFVQAVLGHGRSQRGQYWKSLRALVKQQIDGQ